MEKVSVCRKWILYQFIRLSVKHLHTVVNIDFYRP